MAFPHNHKTVLVLDRSAVFLKSSDQTIDFDVFTKARAPGIIPMAPLSKSLWTCNVEACMEFCRVVFDVYSTKKLIRFVVGEGSGKCLNTWEPSQQNIQHLMSTLAHTPISNVKSVSQDVHLIGGLTEAVQALCQPTPLQLEYAAQENQTPLLNNGTVICLSHFRNESQLLAIEERVAEVIRECNKMAESRQELIAVDHCDVVFIHVVPVNQPSAILARPKQKVNGRLSSELRVSQSGVAIAHKMLEVCTQHYHMCSTTVTGIPMKEEQNAGTSANYDVELLHPADAHDELFISGCADGLVIPSKEGLYTSTVTLKWCTPKTNIVELQQCTGAFRFTPVDINSRPSSCLTNFLLNGRSVMLEQPRKIGTRVVSHMLTSHGGELFIHVLATSRCTLEDPPSISEGTGGRLTDYRIKDFAELMKESRLSPATAQMKARAAPLDTAFAHLERYTRFWPITLSETLIFNMLHHIDPLPSLLLNEELSDEDVLDCKKAIYYVVGMESRNESLPSQQSGKTKGQKRDEQYRQLWAELEKLVRAHSSASTQHQLVLECLLECKRPDDSKPADVVVKKESSEKSTSDIFNASLKELDRYQHLTEREKYELNKADVRSMTSHPAPKRIKTESIFTSSKGPTNLLSLWTAKKTAIVNSKRNEFTGRKEFGSKAPLYRKFFEEKNNSSNENLSNLKLEKPKSEKMKAN